MQPSPSPSGGFRDSFKRRARRLRDLFKGEGQSSTPSSPSPSPQPLSGAPLSQPPSTHEQSAPPPPQPRQSTSLLLPGQHVGVSTSSVNVSAISASQPGEAKLTPAQVAKKVGAEAWIGLKATLNLLERSSDAFPPLKSAVAGFLGVVDVFETAAQNKDDYAELASNLKGIIDEFSQHPGEHTSSKMSDALKAMKGDLEKELDHALEQPQHSGLRRHYEAGQDAIDVQECRRRVDTLCRELQNKVLVEIWRNQKEQQADARLDKLNAALEAMYDSSLSDVVGRRMCTAGTRKTILAEMREWADKPKGPRVYWLNGMAGTGKTTLAYSFCAEMQHAGRLGASFFCSRADTKSQDVSRIVPTVAHQLARLLPSYREALIRQMGEDEEVGARNIETQFRKLMRDPLRTIDASELGRIVVVIDALDECDRRDGAQDILNALLRDAMDLPLKFIVTCRPEPGLFSVLDSKDETRRSVLHLHDIQASFVQADIRTFLEAELASITLASEKLERLVKQAGTLFIYAATAVRYIYPKGEEVDFDGRLEDILSSTSQVHANEHDALNELYSVVLTAPFTNKVLTHREKENIRLVLDTAVCAKEPMSVVTMSKLLGLSDEKNVNYALRYLRSVLHVSQGANLISTLHASFPDFMLDRKRSGGLCCNAAKHHEHLSLRCFSTMHHALRFNICGLQSSFVPDKEVPGLAEKIKSAIPSELLYACRYWVDHVVSVEAPSELQAALEGFLSNRLLFWMEVLNLNRCMQVGVGGLYRVQAWSQKTTYPVEIQQFIRDAAGFMTMFSSNPVSRSTPHIYISALPFWPEQRPVSKQYSQKMKGLPKATGTGMRRREGAALAVYSTPSSAYSVAYSSDGAHIVSGSGDGTIRIWDAHTGKMVGEPLQGHTSAVSSVAYSLDDARIASGSSDNTIRVWDAQTGRMIGEPLVGHTKSVWSVAFSSDRARIVSGSADTTIRLWDVNTGGMIGEPFEGHTGTVYSVAYSSDDTRIVSGSGDNTIRVWDGRTGEMIGEPLEGHTDDVNSVAFSSDDARIVSGSDDHAIRVWDTHTGKMIGAPLEGHTARVWSVAFSTDGARIISGSEDYTIRIWDALTCKTIGEPLKGHTDAVRSVTYSSDGARIVSGSDDSTIRVWDAQTSTTTSEPLEGHTHAVYSVAHSSDGAHLVSGSEDKTIRIWDAHTGEMIGKPLEGHTGAVLSVACSSDGAHIVSGSSDKTIRMWDAHTGEMVGEPLEGHTERVRSVAFSSNGARIVSGSEDSTIRIWDAQTGRLIGEPLEGHASAVISVAYSPDSARIVSGSGDKTIRVWDAHTGTMIGEPLEGHTNEVNSVAYSSDDARIVSGSDDNTVRIWDAHTGQTIGKLLEGHTARVWSVAFSSDNAYIVSGSADNTIRVWNAHFGEMVGEPLQGHTNEVNTVAFSHDGSRIVSGSYDGTIRIAQLGHISNDPCNTWVLDQDGFMVADGSQLVMWVPSDVRGTLLRPRNTAIISTQGSVSVDFTSAHMGDSWAQCYQSR